MPRGQCTFRQRDVTAAIKAAKAAGCEVQRFEIDGKTGRIVIVTAVSSSNAPSPSSSESEVNEWDEE